MPDGSEKNNYHFDKMTCHVNNSKNSGQGHAAEDPFLYFDKNEDVTYQRHQTCFVKYILVIVLVSLMKNICYCSWQ